MFRFTFYSIYVIILVFLIPALTGKKVSLREQLTIIVFSIIIEMFADVLMFLE